MLIVLMEKFCVQSIVSETSDSKVIRILIHEEGA